MDEKRIARFWSRVEKGDPNGCWTWTGATNVSGHGVAWDGKRTQMAHRVAWFATFGAWPDACLLHQCDNPPCCNPAHLFEGSRADNMRDMWGKGRGVRPPPTSTRGADHAVAKLTEDSVVAIIRGKAAGVSGRALAREHGITEGQVSNIWTGRSWRHLDRSRILLG